MLQHLIITGQRDAAENFVKRGLSMRNVEIHREDVGLVVHLPYWRHPSVDVPDECFRVAERQTQVRSSVRAVAVDAPSRVTVRGWAFIENVDLAESEPQVRAFAVARGQDEVELVVRTGVDDAIDELTASGSGYADYRRGAVELDLDVDRLDAGTWHVRLDITVGEISRSGLLSAAWPAGTAALRHAATGAGGRAAMVAGGRNSPLTIEVYDDGAVVHSAVLDGDHLVLSGSGAVPDAVLLASERHPAPLVKAGPLSGDDGWMVELPVTGLTLSATEPVACDVVADRGGELQPVRLAPAGPALGVDDPRLVLGLTHAGQLTAVVHPWIAVIEDVVLDEDRLVVTLTTAGLALDDFDAHFESRPATSVGKVFSLGDGRARIELPYREERWGRAAQVLGSGSLRARARAPRER